MDKYDWMALGGYFVLGALMMLGVMTPVKAADCGLQINLASYHFDREAAYNERNHGGGLACGGDNAYLAVGGYRNSYRNDSVYVVGGYHVRTQGNAFVGIGAEAGYITGYPQTDIMAAPYVEYGIGRHTIRHHVIPSDSGVISLQYVLSFK